MKMFSAHTIHVLHVALRDTLIFFLVLFVAFFVWLKSGISIDHLIFNRYEVEGLYIKLDKKLTLTAHTITIPKSKKRPSFDNIDQVLDRVKYMLTFFHYIELEKVHFKNNHYQVIYADNILYLTSDDYEIAGNVWRRGKVLIADISLFYIKKEDINMVAKLNYNLKSDRLILEGTYDAYHIQGRFKAVKSAQNLAFVLNSNRFSDLKTVIDKIPLDQEVNRWITEKIRAKHYRLHTLSGKGRVHGAIFEPDLASLKGDALLEEATIRFKEGLAPVKAEKILLHYDAGRLGFTLKHARFKKRTLKVDTVQISHMKKGETARLDLAFSLRTTVDKEIQKILEAYHISMPVLHRDSPSEIALKLGIPLKGSRKIDVDLHASLGKGKLYLQRLQLPVEGGEIHYANHLVTLQNVKIAAPWYKGVLQGKIDLDAKKANLSFNAEKIVIGMGKGPRFLLHDRKMALKVDYGRGVVVRVPAFALNVEQKGTVTTMRLADLSLIKPYLSSLKITIDGGELKVTTEDFSRYRFSGSLYRKACFIYDSTVCYTRVPCSGSVTPEGIDFFAFGKRLHYNSRKSAITLQKLNIDLEKFLVSKKQKQRGDAKHTAMKQLLISGIKSHIRYDKYTLLTDRYMVRIDRNGNIKARGNLGTDVATFVKKGDAIAIDALRIHDKMLHPLIHFNGLQGGRYSIRISGNPAKVMKGEIVLEGGVLKSFKAYEKTREFIRKDTYLSKFQSPGLASSGFQIKEGKIDYRIVGDIVYFDSIYIKGTMATIVGKGTLNLQTKKLHIDLAVQTVRKIGKIVGSVPVLGYILMGEDNSVTFALKITGRLEDPKVETSAAKEILKLPFDLIQRIIQSPAHIMTAEEKRSKETTGSVVPGTPKPAVAPHNIVAP